MIIKTEQMQQDIDKLPEEAQILLMGFIELLKKHYLSSETDNLTVKPENIADEPFIGIWKDREDMKDSSEWVRQIRKQEWTE